MKEEKEEIPLKTILQNFLNHVENLEVAREEFNNGEGDDQYEKEFQALKAFSEELKNKDDFSCSEGDSEANRKKNRYKDILPFNYSRVVLSEYPGITGSDYINANYIKGASGSNAYIASQGPLPHTVNDWWRMVVEKEVQVIVMACNEQEAGKHKCECYWSEGEEASKQFGMYTVTLLKSREICPDFLVRTMRLSWTEGDEAMSRTVCQFHYSAWPDHGIPTQVKPLLEMVRLVRDCQASETLPVLVHCSAGCGRTGSICVIDYVWGLLKTGKLSPDFSLYNLVQDMRRQRIAMVQTVDQYMLCHRAVRELFLEQLRVIDSHPYENVGNDGRPLVDREKSQTPEYETIDYGQVGQETSSVDIDKVLSARQNHLPRMGIGMLSREKSGSMILVNGSETGKDSSENSSDNSLPTTLDEFRSVKSTPSGTPKIQPPKVHEPPNPPQNHKESAAQRFKKGNLRLLQSDDGGWKLEELEERRRSFETGENNNDILHDAATKPPQSDTRKEGRRKKSSKEEKSESALLRRPSMKKFKAFFDKDKNKENKEDVKETESPGDKVDSLAGSVAHRLAFPNNEYAQAVAKLPSLEPGTTGNKFFGDNIGLSKSVPSSLDRKQRYNDPDYAQIQEKTSNNNLSKLWPLKKENKPSMNTKSVSSERLQVGGDTAPKPALPIKRSKSMKSGSKPVSVIPVITNSAESSFSVDQYRQDEDVANYDTYPKQSKQKNDELIDLTKKPNYGGDRGSKDNPSLSPPGQPPPKPKRDWSSLTSDYANMKITATSPEEVSVGGHSRQGSGDQSSRSSDFLDQQMAKLMARHRGQDDVDGGSVSRNSEILDDDTKKILRDCQEYLLGASFEAKVDQERSQDTSRSSHSSPSAGGHPPVHQRSSSGNLSLKSPGGRNTAEFSSLQSDTCSDNSPSSDTGPSSMEAEATRGHEYENVAKNSCIDGARGKLSAASNVRGRERRNSFRQAVVDKGDTHPRHGYDNNGRPYEQIWFKGDNNGEDHYPASSGPPTSPRDSLDSGPVYANTRSQLRKSDSGSLRSQGHVRSGSYDNINTTQAIFTLDPNPTAYEIINFQQTGPQQQRGSSVSKSSSSQLQSVGLVAEACRDYERSSSQPKQILTKQNSGGNIRAPPPYQNPPGPPPPHYKPQSGGQFVTPPKHISPSYRYQEAQPQVGDGTPKRPLSGKGGPPPPYPEARKIDVNRTRPIPPQQSTVSLPDQPQPPVTLRQSRSSRDDSELSRRHKNMKRNSSLAATARLSMGDFILNSSGLGVKSVKTVVGGGAPGSVVQGARTAVMMTGGGQVPDPRSQVPDPRSQVPDPRSQVPDPRSQVPDPRSQVPDPGHHGIDLDRVAADLSARDSSSLSLSSAGGQPGGPRQLGRSIAGVLSSTAQNIKSKLFTNMGGGGVTVAPLAARSSPSPPGGVKVREVPIRVEQSGSGASVSPHVLPLKSGGGASVSPHVIPLTVPGAEYGYPHRIEKKPLGPRETPNFQKKQEYL